MTWSHDWPKCRICAALLYPEDETDACAACLEAEADEAEGAGRKSPTFCRQNVADF